MTRAGGKQNMQRVCDEGANIRLSFTCTCNHKHVIRPTHSSFFIHQFSDSLLFPSHTTHAQLVTGNTLKHITWLLDSESHGSQEKTVTYFSLMATIIKRPLDHHAFYAHTHSTARCIVDPTLTRKPRGKWHHTLSVRYTPNPLPGGVHSAYNVVERLNCTA